MKRVSPLLPLLLLALLPACEGNDVRETLGIERRAPDEFRVISRPPLSVPPEFSLRPPAEPGTQPLGAETDPAYIQAQGMVLGTDETGQEVVLRPGNADTAVQSVMTDDLSTPADSQFLQNAGADRFNPEIRDVLKRETEITQFVEEDEGWFDDISYFKKEEPVVNAKEEAARIEQNKEEGKPVTDGDTPTVTPKDKGPLGRILGL